MTDQGYMSRVLQLAERGRGFTSPNPMVGAVVVREGRILGEGYHERVGGPHAEVVSIERASGDLSGATLYVNLEPCCHRGHTPPCTERIIRARISRVVVAHEDPDRRVAGQGLAQLRAAGIVVETGTLEASAKRLNEAYIKHRSTGRPFIYLKWAQSLDGKIASSSGASQWLSSLPARIEVHRRRSYMDGILVGLGTIRADDPLLTVRHVNGPNPIRLILDSQARIPLNARVLRDISITAGSWIVTTPQAPVERIKRLQERGARVLVVPASKQGRVALPAALDRLGEKGLMSILVEGGHEVASAFVRAGLVDRVWIFMAPKLLGEGIGPLGEVGVIHPQQAIPLANLQVERIGEDLLLEGDLL